MPLDPTSVSFSLDLEMGIEPKENRALERLDDVVYLLKSPSQHGHCKLQCEKNNFEALIETTRFILKRSIEAGGK